VSRGIRGIDLVKRSRARIKFSRGRRGATNKDQEKAGGRGKSKNKKIVHWLRGKALLMNVGDCLKGKVTGSNAWGKPSIGERGKGTSRFKVVEGLHLLASTLSVKTTLYRSSESGGLKRWRKYGKV